LRVNQAFVLGEFVQRINLPAAGTTPTGSIVSYGWGSTSGFSGQQITVADVLQTSAHPIIQNDLCAEILSTLGFPFGSAAMCTGPLDATIAKCYGDFGSPLVQIVNGQVR
jgi:Trypsin